ncbi:MAG: hypothetical protein EXR74_05055 [Bdellovibrionales bacterium]|nr:hypothetical protein [Bdellovibrionales bacterium]
MNTKKLKKINPILILVLALSSFMMGCKICPTSKEKIPSIVSSPLRLVSSTDPDPLIQETLSNFTFLVFTFAQDFTGDVKLVLNNVQYDTPVKTFTFNIDPGSKQLIIKYADPNSLEWDKAISESGAATGGNAPVLYRYELGRDLVMNSEQGDYYRFVPFTGVLNPDDTCSF